MPDAEGCEPATLTRVQVVRLDGTGGRKMLVHHFSNGTVEFSLDLGQSRWGPPLTIESDEQVT